MRGLPFWCAVMDSGWARKGDLTVIPVLRVNLTLGAARKYPALNVRVEAADGETRANAHDADAAADATSYAADAAAPIHVAYAATASAAATYGNLTATTSAARAVGRIARASNYASADSAALWRAVTADAVGLMTSTSPEDSHLWPNENPLAATWAKAQRILRDTPGGDFWIDWYQRALDGRPQNWPLLKAVAEIPDALWTAANTRNDPEAHAALDRAIRDAMAAHPEPTDAPTEIDLAAALDATWNGEGIAPNPDTGLLRLVPETALPEDTARYARRKMLKAAELFDDAGSQAYGGVCDDARMIRRAVEDAGNLPVELFDTAKAALTRLETRIRTGDCPDPASDPLLADYRQRLEEAGLDIVANDPGTRAVLERRAAIRPNDALIEARPAVVAAITDAAPLTEGRLADTLPADAEMATDPQAPAEARAAASFRTAGRYLRIRQAATAFVKGGAATGTFIIGAEKLAMAVDYFVTDGSARETINAIIRFIFAK